MPGGRADGFAILFTLAWAAPAAAALILAFPSGGYFISSWGVASVLLLALLAAVALVGGGSLCGPAGAVALGGWAGLAAWQGISSLWAFDPSAAIDAMNLTLLYAAAFALVLLGIRRATDLTNLLVVALVGSAIVTGYALGSRLLPAWVSGDDATRLAAPISYWNGLGTIVAFGAVIAIGLAAHPDRSRWARILAAGLVPMFLLALLLTYSRGSVLVLLVGLGLLLALAPGRIESAVSLVLCVGVSIPALLITNADDSVAALGETLPPHEDAGRRILFLLLVTMAASATLNAAGTLLIERLPQVRRRSFGLGLGACAILALLTIAIVRMPEAGPVQWTKDQATSFTTYGDAGRSDAQSVAGRLAVAAGSGRWQNWGVAADEFSESPVAGTGAGDYAFFWQEHRDIDLTVVNAHSLYLEVLAETGILGLLLLALPLAVTAIVVVRFLRSGAPRAPARDVALAFSAASVVAVHAGGDWDWQLPAVMLPAIALGAASLAAANLGPDGRPRAAPRLAHVVIAVAAVLSIAVVVGPVLSSRALDDARQSAFRGDLNRALAQADDARGLSPLDPAPWLLRANVLNDLGRAGEADAAFVEAARRSPHDWTIFADWAFSLRSRGDDAGARVAVERAAALNPREPRPGYILESLRETP